jgi:hypothetical protein
MFKIIRVLHLFFFFSTVSTFERISSSKITEDKHNRKSSITGFLVFIWKQHGHRKRTTVQLLRTQRRTTGGCQFYTYSKDLSGLDGYGFIRETPEPV